MRNPPSQIQDLSLIPTLQYSNTIPDDQPSTEENWVTKSNLEDILKKRVSNRKLKNVQHLGKRHIREGKGNVYKITNDDDKLTRTYIDLFVCMEIEKNPTPQLHETIAKTYHRESNIICNGLESEGKLDCYAAKSLDSGFGKYRFMFKDGNYLGLATHTKSSGKHYRYRWT